MTDSAIFEAKTKYTKEFYIKFQRFNMFRGGVSGKVMIVSLAVLFIAGVLCIAAGIYTNDYGAAIFPGVFFILLGIFYLFLPQYTTYIMFRKNRGLFDSGVNYSFFDDHFTVTTISDLLNGVNNVKYEGLYKACETKDNFYFYITRVQSFLLNKDGFTLGRPEDLSALLERALPPKKFIKYVK